MFKSTKNGSCVFKELQELVTKTINRTFSEDIDYLESIGGQDSIFQKLRIDPNYGLEKIVVPERRRLYGANNMKNFMKKSYWDYVSIIPRKGSQRLLFVVALVSIIVYAIIGSDRWKESLGILMCVLVLCVSSGYYNYDKNLKLKDLVELLSTINKVVVWRQGGQKYIIPQSELVPGDIIELNPEMSLSADILLIEGKGIKCDEFSLSGEKHLIEKREYRECLRIRDELSSKDSLLTQIPRAYIVPSPVLISGTYIKEGHGKGVVMLTGSLCHLGRVSQFVKVKRSKSPFERKLQDLKISIQKLSIFSITIFLIISVIWFFITGYRNNTFKISEKWSEFVNYFMIVAVLLLMSSSDMIMIVRTLSIQQALSDLAKKDLVVKDVTSFEETAFVNNLCIGTRSILNKRIVPEFFWNFKNYTFIEGFSLTEIFPKAFHSIIKQSFACNNLAYLDPEHGSNIDISLLKQLEAWNIDYKMVRRSHLQSTFDLRHFDHDKNVMMTTIMNVDTDNPSLKRLLVKGNVHSVLEMCTKYYHISENRIDLLSAGTIDRINSEINIYSKSAKQLIGFAFKDFEGHFSEKRGFIFLGFIGLDSNRRPNTKQYIQMLTKFGIKIRLLTAENFEMSKALAIECGITDSEHSIMLDGKSFYEAIDGQLQNDDIESSPTINSVSRLVFNKHSFRRVENGLAVIGEARLIDKYALVVGLNHSKSTTMYIGDSAIDTPSMKLVEIPVAYSSASTLAKDQAKCVLLEDSMNSILKAISWGRTYYANIQRYLQFHLAMLITILFLSIVGMACIQEAIFSPIQLMFFILISEGFAIGMSLEMASTDISKSLNHKKDELINNSIAKNIVCQVIYQFLIVVILVFTGENWIVENIEVPFEKKHLFYSSSGYVRSGRSYYPFSTTEDYKRIINEVGPSRHYTFVFASYAAIQIFNGLISRRVNKDFNILNIFTYNKPVIFLAGVFSLLTLLVVSVGREVFSVSHYGLCVEQWCLVLLIGFANIIWSLLVGAIVF